MDTWIWVVIVVVVVLVIVGAVLMAMKKKNDDARRTRAQELREDAVGHAELIDESRRDAEIARLEAERKRVEAEQAEARAAERIKSHDTDRALHEEQIREADRLDPDVDHTSPDYEPGADPDEPDGGEPGHRRRY